MALRSHIPISPTPPVGPNGNDALRRRITELYQLLAQHTSFVAADQAVRNTTPNGSPLLTKDVDNPAVGADASGPPEPATWGAERWTA